MKKIFTLCACALLSCMSIARAESVTVTIYDENDKEVSSYVTDLTKGTDGSYSIANFINTGCPLSFKFDTNVASGSYTKITPTGNVYKYSSSYYYILTADEDYAVGKIASADGSEILVDTPYLNVGSTSYSYVTRVDKEIYGYEFYAGITFCGYDAKDEDLPDYTLEFGFNAIGSDDPVEEPGDEETIPLGETTVKVCDSKGVEIAKSFKTELSVNSKNVYTIADFLYTGCPVSFTFDTTIPEGSKSAVEFSGNLELLYDYYYYIIDSEGAYPTGKVYSLDDNSVTEISTPYIYCTGSSKSYTYLTHLKKADEGYDYCIRMVVSGEGDAEWYYLYMYFNRPVTTGISAVEANDENAPVEFYNLNGQRVENPANGLFIRKQGSKVQKVVIR